jgi:predicted Zn-dependent protease
MGPPPDTFHCMIAGTPNRPGQLRPGRHGLEVIEGAESRTLPWDAVYVTLGGEAADYVYVRTDTTTVWTNAEGFLGALKRIGAPRLDAQLAAIDSSKSTHRWRARWAVGLFFAVIAAFVALLASVPWLFMASIYLLPTSVDAMLGDAADGELEALGPPLHSENITACIEAPMRTLIAHAEDAEGYDFVIEVRESEEVNAFALPGGRMVALTGLVLAADDQEEAIGVLSHELSHVTHRDGLRAVARDAGWAIAFQMLIGDDGSALLGLAGNVASLVGENAYSRDAESAADEEGARVMARAGYDPLGMARFFTRLEGIEGTEMPHALAWLSTHPEHRERVERVRALAADLPRAATPPSTCDWSALQAELESRELESPELE